MRACEKRLETERLLEERDRGVDITLLETGPRHVHRAIGVRRVDGHHLSEGRLRAAEVPLQQQTDAVVVPASPDRPVGGRRDIGQRRVGIDHRHRRVRLRHDGGRDVGDRLEWSRYARGLTGEHPVAIVIRARDIRVGLRRVAHAGIGPLGQPPRELAIVDLRAQEDAVTRVVRYLQPIVDRVGGARCDQSDVGDRTGHPGISLVDRVAVLVELKAPVEVCAGVDRSTTAVGGLATV